MNKFLLVAFIFGVSMLTSCTSRPENVRELMESDGWEYCCRIIVDIYYEGKVGIKPLLHENDSEYDLFKRGRDYVLTREGSDLINLSKYDSDDEEMESSYWIIYHVVLGNYNVSANNITKKYNAKATHGGYGYGILYFIVPQDLFDSNNGNNTIGGSPSYNNKEGVDTEGDNENGGEIVWSECPICSGDGRCSLCFGSGQCGGCHGSGMIYDAIDHSPGEYIDCNACNGSGACGYCGGSGTCPACNGKGKDVVLKDD